MSDRHGLAKDAPDFSLASPTTNVVTLLQASETNWLTPPIMSNKPTPMSPAEFGVMKILWKLGASTVAEVRGSSEGDPAYTTVMTLLSRLEKKGAVAVDKTRQPYVYKPRMKRGSVLRRRLRTFLDSVFDGRADSLVMQLVEENALSLDELRGLEAKIAELRKREEEE